MRQRFLDEYHPRSVRALLVYQHGQVEPVAEDDFNRMRKTSRKVKT